MEIQELKKVIDVCINNQYDDGAMFFSKISSENEEERINSLMERKNVLIFGKFFNDNENRFNYPNTISYPEAKKEVNSHYAKKRMSKLPF
jgi:hypothetical protein